jgi:hypothetical protein
MDFFLPLLKMEVFINRTSQSIIYAFWQQGFCKHINSLGKGEDVNF